MRIYFVRHGESKANVLHQISNRGLRHGLTAKGRQQAEALAQRLRGHAITRIYSSPLLRAIETSVIIANRMGVEYEVSDALREYDCGVMEGRSDEAAWQAWQELFDAWVMHHRWGEHIRGGESFDDIRARFEPFVRGLMDNYGQTEAEIVCVTHGGLLWIMLPLVLVNLRATPILSRHMSYTTCVVAELRQEGLLCVEWDGGPLAEMPGT